jgi:hypothetical protein
MARNRYGDNNDLVHVPLFEAIRVDQEIIRAKSMGEIEILKRNQPVQCNGWNL